MALSGVTFRGAHFHTAITAAYFIIHCSPPPKFYQQHTMTQMLCTKKFQEFEAGLLEMLRIKVLSGVP